MGVSEAEHRLFALAALPEYLEVFAVPPPLCARGLHTLLSTETGTQSWCCACGGGYLGKSTITNLLTCAMLVK